MKHSHQSIIISIGILAISLFTTYFFLDVLERQTGIKIFALNVSPKPDDRPSVQMDWFTVPTATPTPLPPPPAGSNSENSGEVGAPGGAGGGNQDVVALARKQIGKMYVWGAPTRNWAAAGANPSNFDCSGLVGWAWFVASGGKVKMAGQTSADWANPGGKYQKFTGTDLTQIQPGDLVYFTSGRIHHVGMYSGNGCGDTHCFIDAPQTGKPVRESSLNKRNATSDKMVGFLRPIVK